MTHQTTQRQPGERDSPRSTIQPNIHLSLTYSKKLSRINRRDGPLYKGI
jgi:hypothetical protein